MQLPANAITQRTQSDQTCEVIELGEGRGESVLYVLLKSEDNGPWMLHCLAMNVRRLASKQRVVKLVGQSHEVLFQAK